MSFLSAAFLFALPLAAAPVVLHLLRRRNQQVIRWGAMQFLTDAASEGRRFDQIEEWLLLALRVLAALALIAALARPLVPSWSGQPDVERQTVLVIDDSLSTSLESNGVSAFAGLRSAALDYVDELSAGEAVRVVLAAEGPRWLTREPISATSEGKAALAEMIAALEPTAGAADFPACVRAAALSGGSDDETDRAVVIFADGRREGWNAEMPAAWSRLGGALTRLGRPVSIRVIAEQAEADATANLSIRNVKADRRVVVAGEEVTLVAEVANAGDGAAGSATVSWLIDGKEAGSTTTEAIDEGGVLNVTWRATFDKSGPHEVVAKLDDTDALPLDNSGGVVVDAIDALPVLVVTGDATSAESTAFLSAALGVNDTVGVNDRDDDEWRSPFAARFFTPGQVETQSLTDYRVVIVNGAEGVPAAFATRLADYVRDGGGVWLVVGSRIDREAFNRRWASAGTGLCPAPLGSLVRPEDRDSAEATIHPPEGDHPATAALADTKRLDIDRVRLRRFHTLRGSASARLTPLLESGRGQPLAVLNTIGRGRVIVQTFPLRTDWSDLAISKSFVVMVQDWLAFLSEPTGVRFNLGPREAIEYRVATDQADGGAELTDPNGQTHDLRPLGRGQEVAYRYAGVRLPGRYEMKLRGDKGETTIPFRVARDASESSLEPLTNADRAVIAKAGVRFDGESSEATPVVAASTRLDPFWTPLLIGMLACVAGESFLATRLSRSRYGGASPTAAAT